MNAVFSGNLMVASYLLEHDADPFVVDNCGMTTLMWAADQGHSAICELLIKTGVNINATTHSGT